MARRAEYQPTSSIPRHMVDDLVATSRAPIEGLRAVATALGRETGVLSPLRLGTLIREKFDDEQLAQAVANTVFSMSPDIAEGVLDELRRQREKSVYAQKQLTDAVLADLRDRLPVLIQNCQPLESLKKAMRLARFTGNWYDSADVICDLRPVFNETRSRVEGMIPIQTLRIAYTTPEGHDAVFEVCLGVREADELVEQLRLGKQKTAALQNSCDIWLPNGWVNLEPESAEAE